MFNLLKQLFNKLFTNTYDEYPTRKHNRNNKPLGEKKA